MREKNTITTRFLPFYPCMPSDFFSPQPWFRQDYVEARNIFLREQQQCASIGTQEATSYTHPLLSPAGQEIATDVLWMGPQESNRVVVLISGTHGIEGYAGSATQSFLLSLFRKGKLALPEDMALLVIHALNPWGMAWHRRCDDQGIDINRNFIDFEHSLPHDPDYHRVHPWMFCRNHEHRKQGLAQLEGILGTKRYEEALSGGQYEDPKAPFYGGITPSRARICIESVMQQYRLAQRDLVVLDVHTGLGAWGYGELMCDHPLQSPQQSCAQGIFGAAVTMAADGSSSSVPKKGLLDYAWHDIMSPNSCFLTLEFGSYSNARLFDTIIENHCIWAQEIDLILCHEQSKEKMLSHFSPNDVFWQRSVLFQAWQSMHILFSRW